MLGKDGCTENVRTFALMIKLGLGIPASEGSRVDFFKQVFVEMGDEQDVLSGLSTFASHIQNLDIIIKKCDSSSLILIDEIGTGTEPNQGSALAQAVLEAMLEKQSKIVFTTHYLKLKYLTQVDSRFLIGATSFEKNIPTYKVIWGKMGESFALSLAEKMGMSSKVIERAKALLDKNDVTVSNILEDLEEKRIGMEEKMTHLRILEESILQQQKNLEIEQNKLKQAHLQWEREGELNFNKNFRGSMFKHKNSSSIYKTRKRNDRITTTALRNRGIGRTK